MDLSWHLEWQRKMIYYIKDLFDKISLIKGNKNRKFNIIFMDKGENVTKQANLQSFGANIHDLFNCGLFLCCDDCRTMGEFAKNVIQHDILDGIKNLNKDNQKEIEYKINLIGEPLLKNAPLEKLYSQNTYELEVESIEYLKAKNKKLMQRIEELENKKYNEKIDIKKINEKIKNLHFNYCKNLKPEITGINSKGRNIRKKPN